MCRSEQPRYFPLADGLQWQYRYTRADGSYGAHKCFDDGSVHTSRISLQHTDAGTAIYVFDVSDACGSSSEGAATLRGNELLMREGVPPAWYREYVFPPQLDEQWTIGENWGGVHRWDRHDDHYSVGGQTYDDCWRRSSVGYDAWEIYCRGVGQVQSYYLGVSGNFEAVLVSKNF